MIPYSFLEKQKKYYQAVYNKLNQLPSKMILMQAKYKSHRFSMVRFIKIATQNSTLCFLCATLLPIEFQLILGKFLFYTEKFQNVISWQILCK